MDMQTSEHAHSERVAPTPEAERYYFRPGPKRSSGTLHARCLKADSAGGPAPCGRQKRLGPARGFGSSAFSHSLLQAERGSGASRCRSLARRVRYSRQALCNHRSSHGAAQGRRSRAPQQGVASTRSSRRLLAAFLQTRLLEARSRGPRAYRVEGWRGVVLAARKIWGAKARTR